jgi:hypothetical protein
MVEGLSCGRLNSAMLKLPLLFIVLTLGVVAAPAGAATVPPNGVPSGTYYGYDWATNTVFSATVNGTVITSAAYYTQLFSGTPGTLVPGATTSFFGNQNGGTTGGYRMGVNGTWSMASSLPPGEGPTVPTICGDTKSQTKLVASWNCTRPGGRMAGNPQFSVQQTESPGIADGVYSGQVQTSPVPGRPNAPWTGTTGNLTITVNNGVVSGSGLLAPIDQSTGLITAPPSVNVTYGPVTIGQGSSGNSSVSPSGVFSLASDPPGYALQGGFVPAGIPGLPSNGMVAGTVETTPPTFTEAGPNYGNYIAGSFQIFAAGSSF